MFTPLPSRCVWGVCTGSAFSSTTGNPVTMQRLDRAARRTNRELAQDHSGNAKFWSRFLRHRD